MAEHLLQEAPAARQEVPELLQALLEPIGQQVPGAMDTTAVAAVAAAGDTTAAVAVAAAGRQILMAAMAAVAVAVAEGTTQLQLTMPALPCIMGLELPGAQGQSTRQARQGAMVTLP